jgi:hypothetical protein
MAETPTLENIEKLNPHSLLQNFSKSRALPALILALLIHAVVVGGLSTSYIYRTWIDPTATAEAPAVDPEKSADPAKPADGTEGDPKEPTPGNGENASNNKPATGSPNATDPANSKKGGTGNDDPPPIVKRVTNAADPDDIPDDPGGLGISIDDLDE